MSAPRWFEASLGWKPATARTSDRCRRLFGEPIGPNLADLSGASSTRITGEIYRRLGIPMSRTTNFTIASIEAEKDRVGEDGSSQDETKLGAAGAQLEAGLEEDIRSGLVAEAPDRGWLVTRQGGAAQYAQYEHLGRLQELFRTDLTLKTTVGRDYEVSTDVMVALPNRWGDGPPHVLHAAVSSKLTIRSDRVQNIRVEFGTLVRNRRGRLPHLVVVTAEPMPSRIVSIGRGTGEIDAVYHLLFDDLDQALRELKSESPFLERQWDDWNELVSMRRVRPYSELARVLATG